MSEKNGNGNDLPTMEETTGLRGWAGEVMISPQHGLKSVPGGTMQKGDISNIPNPYVAFDFDTLFYVPEESISTVRYLEKFPVPYLYNKSLRYYRRMPGALNRITDLLKVAYNIMFVYVGPRHLWDHRKELLDPFPYTTLMCVATPNEFREGVARNDQVTIYYTLSAIKAKEAHPKGVLFEDWGLLGLEKR